MLTCCFYLWIHLVWLVVNAYQFGNMRTNLWMSWCNHHRSISAHSSVGFICCSALRHWYKTQISHKQELLAITVVQQIQSTRTQCLLTYCLMLVTLPFLPYWNLKLLAKVDENDKKLYFHFKAVYKGWLLKFYIQSRIELPSNLIVSKKNSQIMFFICRFLFVYLFTIIFSIIILSKSSNGQELSDEIRNETSEQHGIR